MKSSISTALINKAKAVSIAGLLESQGFEPIKETGGELVYLSPLRKEKTPSFHVNPSKNCFYDFGGTEEMKGDAITLACLLWRIGFKEAVQRLLGLKAFPTPSFSFCGLKTSENDEKGIKILYVQKLQHPALIQYVLNRGISMSVAKQYVKEISYMTKGKRFFAVGFKNDAGGFELRNGLDFKGGKTVNGITTFNLNSDSVAVFEGFFDFLSFLEQYGRLYPKITTIVLNTCNNLNKALPILANRKMVHCYLDNDPPGRKTLETMKSKGLAVKNWSELLYPTCKDFNEYLLESRKKGVIY